MDCPLDQRGQRVIKADAERTRVVQLKKVQVSPDKIEKVLTFYSK
jgi:hypothetical protein